MATRKRAPDLKPVTAPVEPVSMTEPPSTLSDAAKAFWRSITASFELQEHHIAILNEALFSWDRCQEARSLIDVEGITVRDRFGSRE